MVTVWILEADNGYDWRSGPLAVFDHEPTSEEKRQVVVAGRGEVSPQILCVTKFEMNVIPLAVVD